VVGLLSVLAVVLLEAGGAGVEAAGYLFSLFLITGLAIAAVGFGFPIAVAAGPGPVITLAILGIMSGFGTLPLSMRFESDFWTKEVALAKVSAKDPLLLAKAFIVG
jgi:hypothetical protein